jgi:hypothetical protein
MNCQAKEVKLTVQEMVDIRPSPMWSASEEASVKISKFADSVSEKTEIVTSKPQRFAFFARALGGTLGVFTIHFDGILKFDPSLTSGTRQHILLQGTFTFQDTWDFDPKAEGERESTIGDPTAEARTKIAGKFMSGRGFKVTSEKASGEIKVSIRRFGDETFVGNAALISLNGATPSLNDIPTFSPLGLKLVEIVRESKDKEFNFFKIIKILKDTCAKTEDKEIKDLCPSREDLQ